MTMVSLLRRRRDRCLDWCSDVRRLGKERRGLDGLDRQGGPDRQFGRDDLRRLDVRDGHHRHLRRDRRFVRCFRFAQGHRSDQLLRWGLEGLALRLEWGSQCNRPEVALKRMPP